MTTRQEHEAEDDLPEYKRTEDEDIPVPAYPMELLSQSRIPNLDPDLIALSAPRPRPSRWHRFLALSNKIKLLILLILLLCIGGVVAGGVVGSQKAERKRSPANLSLALNMVEPATYPYLLNTDGSLLTPLAFSAPVLSNSSLTYGAASPNSSIYTSSASVCLSRQASSSSYWVKVFGNRSTTINLASHSSSNATDWTVNLNATWRVSPGADKDARLQWGLDQLSKTTGGGYGFNINSSRGDESAGFALFPFGNETMNSSQIWNPDDWSDSTITFNATVLIPQRFYARSVEVFSASGGYINVGELNNATFDSVDVRAPLASFNAYSARTPLVTRLLNIFTGLGTVGWFSIAAGELLSHGTIQTQVDFPVQSASTQPYNLTLVTTNGYISSNISSIAPATEYGSYLKVDATSSADHLSGGIDIYLPTYGFNGTYDLATNYGISRASYAYTPNGGGVSWDLFGLNSGGSTGTKRINGKFADQGKGIPNEGSVNINSASGNIVLTVGQTYTWPGWYSSS